MKNDFADNFDAVMNRPLTPAGCAVFLLSLCLGVTVTFDYEQCCDIRRLVVSRDAAESRCRELSAECDARANENMTLRVQLYDLKRAVSEDDLARISALYSSSTNRTIDFGPRDRNGRGAK